MALRRGRRVILRSPAKRQFGETRPGDDRRARHQRFDRAPHGRRTDQQRFVRSAAVEKTVGKNVAAIESCGELNFIDRDEGKSPVARHGLDRRDPITRGLGFDLLFAGDEGDGLAADARDHAVIDLARQKPQRQSDHAILMREHALDRIMRLAGVGRPQENSDATRAFERVELRGGNGNIHREGCCLKSKRVASAVDRRAGRIGAAL